jgi:hypothetical protein
MKIGDIAWYNERAWLVVKHSTESRSGIHLTLAHFILWLPLSGEELNMAEKDMEDEIDFIWSCPLVDQEDCTEQEALFQRYSASLLETYRNIQTVRLPYTADNRFAFLGSEPEAVDLAPFRRRIEDED